MKINNQISADLQFIGSCIKKIQVSNSIINLTNEDSRDFGMDISISDIGREEDNVLTGLVDLGIIVNVKNKKAKKKSKFDIVIQGCFKATNLQLAEDKFGAMLYINGGTALYSIAHSLICNISANTYQSGKLLLPMVNIVEFLKEKVAAEKRATEKANKEQTLKGDGKENEK